MTNGTVRVGIAGATGYVGGELLRLLLNHPNVVIGTLAGNESAGTLIDEHHPHLVPLAGRKIESVHNSTFDADDVVVMALPHGRSANVAKALHESKLVVDCGADFRLVNGERWSKFYGGNHAGSWPYGLPELPGARDQLRAAKRIAIPGCFPTAAALALWPALAQGLVEPEVVIVAATGVSGAGRAANSALMGSEVMGSMKPYGVGGVHRHVPEIEEIYESVAGESVTVSFTPTLAPMTRGILATCVAPLKSGIPEAAVRNAYEHSYYSEPFVHMSSDNEWPSTGATLGSNVAHLQVSVDENARKLVSICAIDNLTRGTAGQAIQCINIALGFSEETGLPRTGLAP